MKYVANSCGVGQPEGIMWVGSDLQLCVGWMLLIVFQRAPGLDDENWTSEA